MLYTEIFKPGQRVIVRCCSDEGSSDRMLEGQRGVVVRSGHWALVKFDKTPKHWANPAGVCFHNLVVVGAGNSIGEVA